MARNCFETACVSHCFDTYSPENIRKKLDFLKMFGDDEERAQYEKYLNDPNYAEEFSVLYEVKDNSCDMFDNRKGCQYKFKEVEYRRPKIEDEKSDVVSPSSQLELECRLDDNLVFGLSVHKATHKTADKDEPDQFIGQIHIPDETIAKLNEERLNRIFEFCSKYGFSTFGLDVPMKDGVVDLDAKLADLMEKYQEEQAKNIAENPGPEKPSEDENDPKGAQINDYIQLVDDVDTYVDTVGLGKAAQKAKENLKNSANAVSLDDIVKNMNTFLTRDLHKRRGLSYWEHAKEIDGKKTYVYSIYDKEDPNNYENDGKPDPKNPRARVPTFSARLYVSQDSDGKFYFGYGTPYKKPFDATLAKQFMGEIKKTGATHVNLQNVPACDQDTLMFAAASRGMVPTGVNISSAKAKEILEKIGKLTAEEQATFKRRLADQMIENAKNKNKDAQPPQYGLPDSEFDFIQDLKERAEDEQADIRYLPIKRKFRNFKDAVTEKSPNGLQNKIKKTASDYMDSEVGAAWICASAQTTKVIFDLYFRHFDETLGDRIAPLIGKDGVNGITKQEAVKLASLSSKKMGEMTTEDFAMMYDVLLPQRAKISKENILVDFDRKVQQGDTRAFHVVLQNGEFQKAQKALDLMNSDLAAYGIDPLKLSLDKQALRFDVPEHLRPKKEKKEPTKTSAPSTVSREGR